MIYFLYFKFQSEKGAVKFVDYMQTRSRITFETRRRICTQNAKASKVIVWSEPPIPNFSLFFFQFHGNFNKIFVRFISMQFFVRAISEKSQKQYISPIFYRHQSKKDQNTSLINELLNMPNFFFHQKDHLQEQVYLLGHIVMLSPQWVTKRTSRALTLMDSVSLEAITVKFVLVLTQIVNKFSSRVSCFNRLDKWKNWNVSWRPEV